MFDQFCLQRFRACSSWFNRLDYVDDQQGNSNSRKAHQLAWTTLHHCLSTENIGPGAGQMRKNSEWSLSPKNLEILETESKSHVLFIRQKPPGASLYNFFPNTQHFPLRKSKLAYSESFLLLFRCFWLFKGFLASVVPRKVPQPATLGTRQSPPVGRARRSRCKRLGESPNEKSKGWSEEEE